MKATDLLQSQTSADTQVKEQSISEDVTAIKQLDGTPFAIVQVDDKFFPVLAEYKLTEDYFETEAEANEFLDKKDWSTIVTVIIAVMEKYNQFNKTVEQESNTTNK